MASGGEAQKILISPFADMYLFYAEWLREDVCERGALSVFRSSVLVWSHVQYVVCTFAVPPKKVAL